LSFVSKLHLHFTKFINSFLSNKMFRELIGEGEYRRRRIYIYIYIFGKLLKVIDSPAHFFNSSNYTPYVLQKNQNIHMPNEV
jgi:hypothetical protein